MARVTYGAMITELAGSIGGVTFQKNSSGSIARLKPNMTVNSSPAQALQQGKLNQLTALWPTLSIADKDSWSTFASAHNHINPWGETKILNSYQWFLSSNLNKLQAGEAAITTAPAWTVIGAPDSFTFVTTALDFKVDFGGIVDYTGFWTFVYITPPIRQSSMKLRRSTFLLKIVDNLNSQYIDVKASYEALFNVTWSALQASGECTIICRILKLEKLTGLASPFSSAILKLG